MSLLEAYVNAADWSTI